jgi:ATP phosphoribosyltransferase
MELAPLVGLADAIVDLVSTGSTLRADQLAEVEQIGESARSRLIANQASMKTRAAALEPLLKRLAAAVALKDLSARRSTRRSGGTGMILRLDSRRPGFRGAARRAAGV